MMKDTCAHTCALTYTHYTRTHTHTHTHTLYTHTPKSIRDLGNLGRNKDVSTKYLEALARNPSTPRETLRKLEKYNLMASILNESLPLLHIGYA